MKKEDRIRYLIVILLVIVASVAFTKCWDVKYVLKDSIVMPDGNVDYFVSRVDIISETFNPKLVMFATLIECCLIIISSKKRFIFLGFVINLIKYIIPFSGFSVKECIFGLFDGLNVEETISHYYLSFYIITVAVCIIAVLYMAEFVKLCVDKNTKNIQKNMHNNFVTLENLD